MEIIAINQRSYPAQHFLTDAVPTVVVLTKGHVDDFAAYVGHGTPEWVRAHGDKLRFEEAAALFPNHDLKEEQYRK